MAECKPSREASENFKRIYVFGAMRFGTIQAKITLIHFFHALK